MTYRALDELGSELDRVIARERRRRVPRLRALLLAMLGAVFVAGATAGASYLLTGSPIPGAHARDVPDEATPLGSTARLMGLDAPDPDGGRPWDVRVSRSRTGQLCTAVGQVADGRLGIVGLDGRWRALPQLGNDTCGQAPLLLGARVFDAPRRADVRTVVSGVAAGATSVVVADRTLELGPEGTFIAVFAGYPEDVSPVVRITGTEGERVIELAKVDRPRAADPVQGSWTVRVDQRERRTCAQVERERTRTFAPGGMSYPVCGDLGVDPYFFEVATLPRAEEVSRPRQTFPWGFAAPRTMVWGAARGDVERIVIDGQPVDLSAKGPGFVAAFPEGTRPADLTVEVTLRGGETRRLVAAQNLRAKDGSRVVAELREPVRIPAVLRPSPVPRSWLVPERGTERVATRLADPAGGPDWAVRTFDARMNTRVAAAPSGRRLRCAQLGRIVGGRFAPASGRGTLPLDDPGSACSRRDGDEPARRINTFVDDARAYAPRLQRTVAWGVSRAPVALSTPSGVQRLPRGAFLALFGPEVTAHELSFSSDRRKPRLAVVPGSERIVARAPDPDGGAPYGMLEWRTAGGEVCHYVDRAVGDTVGGLHTPSNRFAPYPVSEGGSCGEGGPPRSEPLLFGVSTRPDATGGAGGTDGARRTLPGRTIISGTAHPDVRDITIQTPRDVRTLRPAGPSRAFLAVYDGEFFSGEITLTARRRDGTTHRRTLPVGG